MTDPTHPSSGDAERGIREVLDKAGDEVGHGPVAAALLAAAFGTFVFGISVVVAGASPSLTAAFSWWPAAGPLGGTAAVGSTAFFASWLLLHLRLRRRRRVNFGTIMVVSFALIALGLMLTFPPVWTLLLLVQEAAL